MSSVTITRRDQSQTWSEPTGETHRFVLRNFRGFMLEVEDLHFHLDSAVLLPDYRPDPQTEGQPDDITAFAVLATCYHYAQQHTDQRILIAGHADTSGDSEYNVTLSALRAKNVLHVLQGNSDEWVSIAKQQSKVEDYQLILKWMHREWGWNCDPGEVDNQLGPHTESALRIFQGAYNQEFDASIAEDGEIGPQTWKAIFDVYVRALQDMMGIDEAGLNSLREQLQFLDAGPTVSCGESFPIDESQQDNYRSAANRRVEILFFEPGQEPQLDCHPSEGTCSPRECEIYNSKMYRFEPIPCDPVLPRIWLELQTVDELGYCVGNIALHLEPGQGEPHDVTTNANGYWSGRLRGTGSIRVTLADGSPVRFAASARGAADPPADAEDAATAVIDPTLARQAVTNIVVPTIPADQRQQHDALNRRYRPRADDSNAEDQEPKGERSKRGDENTRLTSRQWHEAVADNVFIAGGWCSGSNDLAQFQSVLHEWLVDRLGTAIDRGYYLVLIGGQKARVFDDQKSSLAEFDIDANRSVGPPFGGFATFEFLHGGSNDRTFVDIESESRTIAIGSGNQSEAKTGTPPQEQDDSTGTRQGLTLADLVVAEQRDACLQLCARMSHKVEVVYQLESEGLAILCAQHGGTGLLEDYVNEQANPHVHKRNLAVVRNCRDCYLSYLNGIYIKAVKAADDEEALHKLGPPESPHQFPRPVGATDDQWLELAQEMMCSTLSAWQAIADRLDHVWNQRSEGSLWFKCEFEVEGPKPFMEKVPMLFPTGKFSWNFEVDDEGRFKLGDKVEKSFSVVAGREGKEGHEGGSEGEHGTSSESGGEGGEEGKGDGKSALPFEVELETEEPNEDTGRRTQTGKLKIGPYAFEAGTDGELVAKVGTKGGEVYSTFNFHTAQMGTGYELSTKELVEAYCKSRKIEPEWLKYVPELKVKGAVSYQGVREGTLLTILSDAPGFFEMRPRSEFIKLDWNSLDSDEQHHLGVLGWDHDLWDSKRQLPLRKPAAEGGEEGGSAEGKPAKDQFPVSARTEFYELRFMEPDAQETADNTSPTKKGAEMMVAAVHLPIPNSDPYWVPFWKSLSKSAEGESSSEGKQSEQSATESPTSEGAAGSPTADEASQE